MPLKNGQLLQHDRYRIEYPLGQGGMGAVYRAWDSTLNIAVAIKENLDTSKEAQEQFIREAQILARLSHPNLPRVTDYFFIPDQGQYLVMDFVEGEDLQTMITRLHNLPEPQVLHWIAQVCDALAYLHSQPSPIIHRDIKPGNIRVRPDGRAMLVDFGIAKIYDPQLATTIGARAVTPGYSPPEQYGGGHTDQRSDIYALGATFYALLTGQAPPESVRRMTMQASTTPPRQINQQITPEIERVVLKALEVPTERRFQTADEMGQALAHQMRAPTQKAAQPAARGVTPPRKPAPLQRPAQPARAAPAPRSLSPLLWILLAGFGLLAILVFGGGIVTLLVATRSTATFTPPAAALITDTPITNTPAGSPATDTPASPADTDTPTPPATPTLVPSSTPPPTVTAPPTTNPVPAQYDKPGLLAYYPLHSDAHDLTGRLAPLKIENAPFQDGGVYCSGIYPDVGVTNPCIVQTPNIAALDLNNFSIGYRFKPAEYRNMPVFIGGSLYRWLALYLNDQGHFQILYNNQNYTDCPATYQPGIWYETLLAYNGQWVDVYLDNQLVCSAKFALEHGNDREFLLANMSNAQTYHGVVSDLRIYTAVVTP